MNYEEMKTWFSEKENKQKVVFGICYVLVFIVGFGAGSYKKSIRRDSYKPQANYTTQSSKKPIETVNKEGDSPPAADPTTATVLSANTTKTPVDLTNCIIKGNIGAGNKKIYHVKGGSFYNRVKPEQCFNTEAEAQAAGFVKSSR